jgi:hypothetical protein
VPLLCLPRLQQNLLSFRIDVAETHLMEIYQQDCDLTMESPQPCP